jgi:HAD superfamily hydrolase (TIGR01509 family)
MKKHIIFDLDGVLVDTEKMHQVTLKLAAREFGFVVDPSGNSTTLAKLTRAQVPEESQQLIYARKRALFDDAASSIKHDGYLEALLQDLVDEDVVLSVCSNSNMESVNKILKRLGIAHLFRYVVTSSDVDRGKPAPDIYLRMLELLQCPVEDILVFEDSDEGIAAAAGAGLPNIIRCTHDSLFKELKNVYYSHTSSR